ncbi:transposase [Trichodesmium erythraeum IMS101]|uniref:Transposase n=1 Tax=Trichodesmium erythraeum (strain IMS101) TaxID=203124 RepID=Q10V02_TRIEI
MTVFIINEFSLLCIDILGFTWVKTDERIEIVMKNEKEKQTYYGALDYQTKEFIVQELKKWKY